MLPRATKICEILRRELERREKVLEIDRTLTKIHFEIILGKRSGDPVMVRYNGHSETDLTAAVDLSKTQQT